MNRISIVVILSMLLSLPLSAQEDNPFGSIDDIVFSEWKDLEKDRVNRHHQKLEWHYNGYFVELSYNIDPLPRSFENFERYGIIHVDERPNGMYSYGIKASFNRKKEAVRYFRDIVSQYIKEAHLYRYKKGKRKKVKV